MLNLVIIELLKLRRRKFIWLMLFTAIFMPVISLLYFGIFNKTNINPIKFYKWTSFSYTPWIILPLALGMICTMLMYYEIQNDMLKQLWIVPVSKRGYFFSKFIVVIIYSLCFMLLNTISSIIIGVVSDIIVLTKESVIFLIIKCFEIAILTPFAMIPILAIAASQKGYLLSVCVTITYTFIGFILIMVKMYLHPLSSVTAIVMRNIEGVTLNEPINIGKAIFCIIIWDVISTVWAEFILKNRK